MGAFTKIPSDTFQGLQVDAGVLLTSFNPASPAVVDSAIITATTGGITVSAVASYEDLGEDVDNCPNNMMELKKLIGWDCKISCTALDNSVDTLKLALGAADKAGKRVVPRRQVQQGDFSTIWWVGDRADGGFVAVKLENALSTGGLSLKTGKNEKGQITVEITGHVSISAQNVVPMEFYSSDPIEYTVTNTLSHATNTNTATKAAYGSSYLASLQPDSGYAFAANAVTVTMGGTAITTTAYDDGIIRIDEVTGNIVITATATSV